MNKRDADILAVLLVKLTVRAAASPKHTPLIVSGGEARAIQALIREWVSMRAQVPAPVQEGLPL